ncbi:MAG TPA: hypothetical protein VMU39_02905 [Solirubrobacteraceae bacterium]|nr:hypothetical protein [Solirubrobacteraceae bacterium]
MSSSETPVRPTPSTTEIVVVTGERYRVEGTPKEVERTIVDAARGSIMQLAWLVEAETGADLAVNPDHIVTLRAAGS